MSIISLPRSLPGHDAHDELTRRDSTASSSSRASKNRTQDTSAPKSQPPTQMLSLIDSDAMEELTFQFDDDREAELHEDALAHGADERREAGEPVPVEQVHRVLALIEDQTGYALLKRMAQRVAAAAEQEPERFLQSCLQEMDYRTLDAKQRYAVLNMAHGLLRDSQAAASKSDVPPADGSEPSETSPRMDVQSAALLKRIGELEEDQGPELRQMFEHLFVAKGGQGIAERGDALTKLLSSAPNPRSIAQAASAEGGLRVYGDRLARSLEGGRFSDDMINVGVVVGLSRMVALVRTMQDKSTELIKHAHGGGTVDQAEVEKQTTALMDMAAAPSPGVLVERFVAGLTKGRSRAQRDSLNTRMLLQLPSWPPQVWVKDDAREQVRKTLLKPLVEQPPKRPPTLVGPAAADLS